jgi:hypothetical protein
MVLKSMFGRVVVLALALGLGVPLTANAAFTLTLSSNGYSETFHETSPGVISVSEFGLNGFLFQGDFATSNSHTGQSPAYLTLTQASVRNWWTGGIRELTITLVDTDFVAPLGQVNVNTNLVALDLNGSGNIRSQSFVNGVQVGDDVTLAGAGSGRSSGSTFIEGNRYTLSSVTTIRLGQGGILLSNGSTEVSPVPAPATVVMALAGVPVLGAFGWMRRRVRSASPPTI